MKKKIRKALVVVTSIFLINLCLPLEKPDPFSNCPIVNTIGKPSCNLLSDELEAEIRVI